MRKAAVSNSGFSNSTECAKHANVAQLRPSNGKEVNAMLESFCNLLIGIGASVIGTYICKWLDDRNKGN